jgi:hypothetical protein
MLLALTLCSLMLAACGGGAGSTAGPSPAPIAGECIPADPATAAECGTLIIGLTDADGDFLSYTVDVLSLKLERRDGAVIDVLPNRTRIDFARYVDLTEFVSVATVPPGDYVAGRIGLDYTAAEVFVEAGGEAKETQVVDADGAPVGTAVLDIRLADRDHLLITRGRPALLTLDFDLDASHTVDTGPTPAVATAEPFIIAEVDPVDARDIRVRGRLVEANVEEMHYTVAIRPFHDASGDFGRVRVNVTERTDFEINEQAFVGAEGLRALSAAGQGTLTVAKGVLDVAGREFVASYVVAGTSVPGNGMDAVKGSIISRVENKLTVRGGTVILSDSGRAFFRDDVTVIVGPGTIVYKAFRHDRPTGMPLQLLDIGALSIGQAVTVRGEVVNNDENVVLIDATQGTVAMHLAHLSGTVKAIVPGQVDIDLHAIDRRRVEIFDFAGTGMTSATDADPANYEVATGNLATLASDATGQPVVVYGFPHEFGVAPPDFEGRTLIDYSDVRSALGVGWGAEGTTMPFTMMDESGLLLNNRNPDIDHRHYIRQGPILVDLTTLDSDTLIAPRESGRVVFTIKTGDSLQLFSDFGDFVKALTSALSGSAARSMYARGHFDAETNEFAAYRIFVHILEP